MNLAITNTPRRIAIDNIQRTIAITVRRPARVAIQRQGTRGPPGPTGPAGPGAEPFEHFQPTPAGTWIIPHGLGRRPLVTLYLETGEKIEGDIWASAELVSVVFAEPTAGSAVLI